MSKLIDFKEFERICEEIKTQTRKENPEAIVDGVINTQKYFNIPADKPKILWILKEANSQDSAWNYQDLLSSEQLAKSNDYSSIPTIKKVLYISYSILNEFINYDDILGIQDKCLFGIAEEIAYININKDPGGKGTVDNKAFNENLEKYRIIVQKQIDAYCPDIIILGNTKNFLNINLFDESLKSYSDDTTHNTALYEYADRLIINAYHPSARSNTITEKVYCNEIIEASEKWWLNKLDKKS